MRFLFIVIPEKGHLHPMLGPAAHLQQRGHDVAFHAVADISEPLRQAGLLRFLPLPSPLAIATPEPAKRGREFAQQLADSGWLRRWIYHLLLETVPPHVAALNELLKTEQPDVMVADPMVYSAVIVARQAGIPWVAMSNSLNPVLPAEGLTSELLATVDWLAEDRDALFQNYDQQAEFSGCDALSEHLTLAFTTEELIGGPVSGVELVGPSMPLGSRGDEPEFPWQQLTGEPLIVMSFGSQIYYQPERFRSIIDAVRGHAVQLVLSIGDLPVAELGDLPANVLARPYLPQLQLLRHADLLITHGGANSVMEALNHGVPIWISPICNDQFHQAHFIEQRGVGRHLDLPGDPDTCWRTLNELLGQGPHRTAAGQVRDSYRQAPGAAGAANLVEALG